MESSIWLIWVLLIFLWLRLKSFISKVNGLERKLEQMARSANSESKKPVPAASTVQEMKGTPEAKTSSRPPDVLNVSSEWKIASERMLDISPLRKPGGKKPNIPETLPKEEKPLPEESSPPILSADVRSRAEEKPLRVSPPASPKPSPAAPPRPVAPPPAPGLIDRLFLAAKAWLLGGNTVVRVGLVILFLGLAFLLRLASQYVTVPTEFYYICVAGAAFVLLAFGWKLRLKNPAYGLLLQGGGVGVLYLTSFAALRLAEPALLSSGMAFVLMALLTIAAVTLALLQNSMALACAAIFGAFAAPILASSGSGDHVALFSYFALLNTGIALIAWFKAWRTLNLIGFFGTFSIGMTWGLLNYTEEKFASTQPFLVLFFLMFALIGMLFARRKLIALPEDGKGFVLSGRSSVSTDYIDGTLVFGPALIGFGLQCVIISHIEFGMAYSALALGLFYLTLAYLMRGRKAISLMMDVCIALGVVFGTLAIPLAFKAEIWTSAAWALEAAGIYWIGHAQRRTLPKFFAMAVLSLASLVYLNGLDGTGGASLAYLNGLDDVGGDALASLGGLNETRTGTLLDGSPLGAALLGLAWLFCYRTLRRAEEASKQMLPVFAVVGLFFLYLIAPLCFGRDNTVIAWTLASVATVFLGLSLRSKAFIVCAFAAQAFAGLLFVSGLSFGRETPFSAGWMGAFVASLLGIGLIANLFIISSPNNRRDGSGDGTEKAVPLVSPKASALAMLFGLAFFSMAFAFVLDWNHIGAAWAGVGILLVCLGLWQRSSVSLFFGMALELIAGSVFLFNLLAEIVPPNGWIPAVIALAAFAGAWRLHHVAQRSRVSDSRENAPRASKAFHPDKISAWSSFLLTWGVGWWVWCAIERIWFYSKQEFFANTETLYLPVIVLSAVAWLIVSRLARWRLLALFCLALVEVSGLALAKLGFDASLLSTAEWIAYFTMHFIALWYLSNVIDAKLQRVTHVLGAWLLIFFLTLATCFAAESLVPDAESAWRWLGWALAPSLYLWLMASERMRFWPLGAFSRQYRFYAAGVVMVVMLGWFWFANLFSSGSPAPLPYLPLINPLELGLLLVLLGCMRWSRFHLPDRSQSPDRIKRSIDIVAGVSLFALLTQMVCRTAHAFGGVGFSAEAMMDSMGVQAGWSIVWTLFALTLMIGGSIKKHRNVWVAGALLSGVVVVKLFLIDLDGHGDISRVISFIGVGALLLVVGYFAPLPPKGNSLKIGVKGVDT